MSRTEQGRAARKQGVDHELAPHRSSKDTRRWCLGKVGREHDPKWVASKHERHIPTKQLKWLDYRCQKCGKEIDRCWPWHVPDKGSPRVGRRGCVRGCSNKHKSPPIQEI